MTKSKTTIASAALVCHAFFLLSLTPGAHLFGLIGCPLKCLYYLTWFDQVNLEHVISIFPIT